MVPVGARPDDGVDQTARVAPELSAELAGLYAELLQRIRRRKLWGHAEVSVNRVDTVHQEVIRTGTISVDDGTFVLPLAVALTYIVEYHPWHQKLQLQRVAAIQGQVNDSALVYNLNDCCLHKVNAGRRSFNGDLLSDFSQLHGHWNSEVLIHLKQEFLLNKRLEPFLFHLQGICPDCEEREIKIPRGVGLHGPCRPSPLVGDGDLGIRNDSPRFIADRSDDRSGRNGRLKRMDSQEDEDSEEEGGNEETDHWPSGFAFCHGVLLSYDSCDSSHEGSS